MRSTKAAAALCVMLAAAPLAFGASTEAGGWTATASMSTPRAHATATLLGDGRVLMVGGVDELGAELCDPAPGAWPAGGTRAASHWGHVAVRLADGRVLVTGGGRYSADSELYDPATNGWTRTGSTSVGRISFTGTLLGDGRVLVVGGL